MWGSFRAIAISIVFLIVTNAWGLTCTDVFTGRSTSLTILGKSKKFSYNGQNLNYSFYKKSQKPTVLFIHGLGDSLKNLKPMAEEFVKTGYSVLLVDLIGHGETLKSYLKGDKDKENKDVPYKITMDEQVEILRALLESLKIDNLHIVGHSYGGGIGIKLATELKTKVLSLTLLATLVEKLNNYYLDPFHDLNNYWSEVLDYCIQCSYWNSFWNFWMDPTLEYMTRKKIKELYVVKYPDDPYQVKISTDAAMAIIRGIGSFSALKSFRDIDSDIPILIINASTDPLSPKKLNDQLFSKLNKNGNPVTIVTFKTNDHHFPQNIPTETAKVIMENVIQENMPLENVVHETTEETAHE